MKVSECKQIFSMLSEYLDEELPDDICRDIESHISACPPCIQFVESLKKSVHLCRSCGSVDKPGPISQEGRDELLKAYQEAVEARKRAQA
jgi:hypothetical protein